MSTPVLFTASEVAKILRCKEPRVRELMHCGRLGYINIGGARGIRISGVSLDAFIATVEPSPVATNYSNARVPKARLQHLTAPSPRGNCK